MELWNFQRDSVYGMTADRQAITLRVPIEIHDWLRERSYESRLSQAGILLGALDVARRRGGSAALRAVAALSARFETVWFTQGEAWIVINDLLAERPHLWQELDALGYITQQKCATSIEAARWEVVL